MTFTETDLEGLLIIQPKIYRDERGYFFESFNHLEFKNKTGLNVNFLQDNQSKSSKNVVRGLHFQNPPNAQGKLIRVLQGSVMDVVVDIRLSSLTYGQHFKIILDTKDHKMLYIPEGFAHGFATLENETIFSYKCTDFYHKESEDCLLWNDPDLKIDWGINEPILSEKDQHGKKFSSFVSKF